MTPDIYHIELIGSGSLSVMAKPVSGEWIDDEFSGIAQTGIDLIVSLLEIEESYEVGLDKEQVITEKYGMKFISYPIPDRGLPSSISNYLNFTKDLYHTAAGGAKIFVHCRAGIGRTGVIAAGVLLHCGFEPKEAFELISEKRGVTVPDTDEQVDWVSKSFSRLKNIIS